MARPHLSLLEDCGRRRLVRLLGAELALYALDLLLQLADARLELGNGEGPQVFAQRDALLRLRLEVIPVHGRLLICRDRANPAEPGTTWPLSQPWRWGNCRRRR